MDDFQPMLMFFTEDFIYGIHILSQETFREETGFQYFFSGFFIMIFSCFKGDNDYLGDRTWGVVGYVLLIIGCST